MAKFNEKVLCLFSKNCDQLKKEAERRGMRPDGREKTIAKVIWKDAYDTGFTEGKNFASALSNAVRNCPANCCGNAKPEVKEYCLYDINNAVKYRLELTEEQVSAIEWMIDHQFMVDVELSEWCDSFEDVGRI
jgi:adenine C2-methylase RlmN of 23S rRNA A2503 and tRNA A37